MFLGITRHPNAKIGAFGLIHKLFQVLPPVHGIDLPYQIHCVPMPTDFRFKLTHNLIGIATQGSNIMNTQKVKVDKGILGFVHVETTADQMGHHIDVVSLLNGRRQPNSTGPAPYFHRFSTTA